MSRADASTDLLEIILRECAAAQGKPWYPSDYAAATGVDKNALNDTLDQLRIGGLVQLTEWVKDKGQGYVLTPQGQEILEKPALLGLLRKGSVAVRTTAPPPAARSASLGDTHLDRGDRVRHALLSDTRPVCTYSLIGVNVFIFLLPVLLGTTNPLVGKLNEFFGPVSLAAIREGRWDRLVSHAFLHDPKSLWHIGLNMYALFTLGGLMERLWGKMGFLAVYFVSAVSGGVAHVIYSDGAARGASGAICGLLTSMGVWVLLNRGHLPQELTRSWLANILQNLVLVAVISTLPGVGAWGHGGGAVGGALVSFPLVFARYHGGWRHWAGVAGVIVMALAPFAVLEGFLEKHPNNPPVPGREVKIGARTPSSKIT